jgi:hypothetical protein
LNVDNEECSSPIKYGAASNAEGGNSWFPSAFAKPVIEKMTGFKLIWGDLHEMSNSIFQFRYEPEAKPVWLQSSYRLTGLKEAV